MKASSSPSTLPVVDAGAPAARKPPVDPATLRHREFDDSEFWRAIPAYADVSRETFLDHHWQAKNSVTRVSKLLDTIRDLVPASFIADVEEGLAHAPMSIRLSPYVLSLIDWSNPVDDPIRRQFLPLASTRLPDHPKLDLDSLHEKADMPVPGLTHRYPDKALFLVLDTCPVYCRFCTRSYAVGIDTEEVHKYHLRPNQQRWEQAFAYIRSRPELEDIVVSGGDVYQLRPDYLRTLGMTLLDIDHVRRFRFATKGPAIMPMKILTDDAWFRALADVVEEGRRRHKEVVVHTHFNHPTELTDITRQAIFRLFEAGITVRNQTVLLRGVNDDPDTMRLLIRKMGWIGVHAYYVYQHDMVKGVEDLRTRVADTVELEKEIRGATAGFNTPTFVVDAPGGGGKRVVHSYEYYDRVTGISVYRSPNVDPEAYYCYFDPIDTLPEAGRARWADPAEHDAMVAEAIEQARARRAGAGGAD
ncbi:MAG: KamA family radical SAM protein [Deltaproteobacteria bacterium]|nr:MAG: KamA family radical SAM protein [Deltaproteobacteria bacterium]